MAQDNIDLFDASELVPDYPELQGLAHALLEVDPSDDEVSFFAPDSANSLQLSDLLADDAGEIVLDVNAHLALVSNSGVTNSGMVEHHVTASGEDVSGFAFTTFDTGITVYYPQNGDGTLDSIVA